jgi:hypothetical protein
MKTRSACYVCGGFLLLVLGACAPSTTTKPDGSARVLRFQHRWTRRSKREGERGGTKEATYQAPAV